MNDQDRANAFLKRLVKTIPENVVGGAGPVHTPGIKPVKPKPSHMIYGGSAHYKPIPDKLNFQKRKQHTDRLAAQGKPHDPIHNPLGYQPPKVTREVHFHGSAGGRGPRGNVRTRDAYNFKRTPATEDEERIILQANENRREMGYPSLEPEEMARRLQSSQTQIRIGKKRSGIRSAYGIDHSLENDYELTRRRDP